MSIFNIFIYNKQKSIKCDIILTICTRRGRINNYNIKFYVGGRSG